MFLVAYLHIVACGAGQESGSGGETTAGSGAGARADLGGGAAAAGGWKLCGQRNGRWLRFQNIQLCDGGSDVGQLLMLLLRWCCEVAAALIARQQWAELLGCAPFVQIHREGGHQWGFLDANVLLVHQLDVLPILVVGGPGRGCCGCRRRGGCAASRGSGSWRGGCGGARGRGGCGSGRPSHIADFEFDLVTTAVMGDLIAAHGSGTGGIHTPGKLAIFRTLGLHGFRFEWQGNYSGCG